MKEGPGEALVLIGLYGTDCLGYRTSLWGKPRCNGCALGGWARSTGPPAMADRCRCSGPDGFVGGLILAHIHLVFAIPDVRLGE